MQPQADTVVLRLYIRIRHGTIRRHEISIEIIIVRDLIRQRDRHAAIVIIVIAYAYAQGQPGRETLAKLILVPLIRCLALKDLIIVRADLRDRAPSFIHIHTYQRSDPKRSARRPAVQLIFLHTLQPPVRLHPELPELVPAIHEYSQRGELRLIAKSEAIAEIVEYILGLETKIVSFVHLDLTLRVFDADPLVSETRSTRAQNIIDQKTGA